MPNVIKETRETRSDLKRLYGVDVTGRQRPAPQRRARDAERHQQARADGHGVINETVLACRSGTRQQQVDRAAMRKQGFGGRRPQYIADRREAFLLQTGRANLTVAQMRSLRRRSTREEIAQLAWHQKLELGVR